MDRSRVDEIGQNFGENKLLKCIMLEIMRKER